VVPLLAETIPPVDRGQGPPSGPARRTTKRTSARRPRRDISRAEPLAEQLRQDGHAATALRLDLTDRNADGVPKRVSEPSA